MSFHCDNFKTLKIHKHSCYYKHSKVYLDKIRQNNDIFLKNVQLTTSKIHKLYSKDCKFNTRFIVNSLHCDQKI